MNTYAQLDSRPLAACASHPRAAWTMLGGHCSPACCSAGQGLRSCGEAWYDGATRRQAPLQQQQHAPFMQLASRPLMPQQQRVRKGGGGSSKGGGERAAPQMLSRTPITLSIFVLHQRPGCQWQAAWRGCCWPQHSPVWPLNATGLLSPIITEGRPAPSQPPHLLAPRACGSAATGDWLKAGGRGERERSIKYQTHYPAPPATAAAAAALRSLRSSIALACFSFHLLGCGRGGGRGS